MTDYPVKGAGLGLRRAMLGSLQDLKAEDIDFMEVAPENWIGMGGRYGKQFKEFSERFPIIAHGLSLSIGGPEPLDDTFLHKLKQFIKEYNIPCYSEHLSYCSDNGHLYDLMPIPFTEEAVHYVADRISRVQDVLEQALIIENVSYYASPGAELSEIQFLNAVLEEADCQLLLDVNNIYVNSVNHKYDAVEFLKAIPEQRIAYIHVAGHYNEDQDLIVDTHGAPVIQSVWQLLDQCYAMYGSIPTLLERDFNFPPLAELLCEIETIRKFQSKYNSETGIHEKFNATA